MHIQQARPLGQLGHHHRRSAGQLTGMLQGLANRIGVGHIALQGLQDCRLHRAGAILVQ